MNQNSLRVGQKIYSLKYGWGEVIQGDDNPVVISFGGFNIYSYEFLNGKAVPMDIDYTELQMKEYTYSEMCEMLKNDLMTEQEKEEYDEQMKKATISNDSFII
jgi:hypothetical protein